METGPLKSFAIWARTALIREVTARISVVLTSQELRQEQPNAVAALEKAINAASGGDKGRDTVADRVAYTWFNRIIALRFMDANGYTGIGVVSPERDRRGGQPEVLAEAKRGNVDSAVVRNKRTVETVTSLLNGVRRSDDPQGEAYALLLAEYCRHWNRSMPFMFEQEGDYTELLIPANLLADDSVLARAVAVLTEEVCQDVEVIGWLYQFYIFERKAEVFANFKKNKKAGASEIPAATQLFTPHWIVRYLVENSLGRLWLLNRPTSRLADQMDYYIAPTDNETDYLKVSSPEELKVVDPACGSGHMLTYAFDLLYAIYEEEGYAPSDIPALILANNLYGTEIDARAGTLAAFALTMKARSRQRTFFNKQVEPNVCVLDPVRFTVDELEKLVTRGGDKHAEIAFWQAFGDADTIGSLIRPNQALIQPLTEHLKSLDEAEDLFGGYVLDRARTVIRQSEYLSTRYHVVVANPPYMGAKNMDAKLSHYAKSEYSSTKSDAFAMFIEQCSGLTVAGGATAMVTMQSWMFLSSFLEMRRSLLNRSRILSMAHLGSAAFDSIAGDVVSTTSFVLQASRGESSAGTFIRLVDGRSEKAKSRLLAEAVSSNESDLRFSIDSSVFLKLPSASIAYWLDKGMTDAFDLAQPLHSKATPRAGMITGDNARFVRLQHEVSLRDIGFGAASRDEAMRSGRRWFPYQKGGPFRRYFGNVEHVVDWQNDGHRLRTTKDASGKVPAHAFNDEFIFKGNVNWSAVSGSFSCRVTEQGSLFDASGSGAFPRSPGDLYEIAGFLNSRIADEYLKAINPTVNFQAWEIGSLPYIELTKDKRDRVAGLTREAVSIAKQDWESFEISLSFIEDPIVAAASTSTPVSDLFEGLIQREEEDSLRLARLQTELDEIFCVAYGQQPEVLTDLAAVSLLRNSSFRYAGSMNRSVGELRTLRRSDIAKDLVSYAVGCMFGRYSLDSPGLVLADQGNTLADYLAKVPSPSFMPDADNVLPILSDGWFEDDIVERFREFLKVSFGEERFDENLRFLEDSLGKDVRKYFAQDFYKDHVQRYKKRPIYWLFSSPKGSFSALIYMHRYTPSNVSTVLNEYLREFKTKLAASRQHYERLAAGSGTPREQAAAQKEVDRLRKVLLELDEYEHDVLYPLATQQVQIDLDDGVKANYPKLGAALKKIPGLEASDE